MCVYMNKKKNGYQSMRTSSDYRIDIRVREESGVIHDIGKVFMVRIAIQSRMASLLY